MLAAVGFIMLPVFTRYLSPQDYGILALTQLFGSFLPLVLSLQMHSSIGRFYFDYERERLKTFMSTIGLIILVFASFGFIILSVFLIRILSFVFPKIPPENYILFKLALIAAFFNTITSVSIMLLRVREEAKLFMKISLSLFFIGLIISIIEVVVFKKGAYGIMEATLVNSIIGFVAYTFFNRHFFGLEFDITMLKAPLKYSLPVIPHALSGLIFMYSDRIILEKYVSLAAIGLYALSDKVAFIFKTIVNQLNIAFQPHFVKSAKINKEKAVEDARDLARTTVFLLALSIAITAIFSVEIVYYMLDKRFFKAWIMIPILASSYIFRNLYCFSSSGLYFEKKTGKIPIITMVAAVVNILINLIFIPRYGVIAAVFSTLIAFITTYIMAELISLKIFHIKFDNKVNLLFMGYMYLSIIVSFFINSKFTIENPSLPFNMYIFKILIICFGLYLGFRMDLLNFRIFKKVVA